MGMTIDEAIKIVRTMHYPTNGDNEKERDTAIMLLLDIARKYQKIQADYEKRLKADMVAMLADIQLEIKQNQIIAPQDSFYDKKLDGQFNRGISKASEIIQEKINALKEDTK